MYYILVLGMRVRVVYFNGGVYSAFSHRNDLPFTSREYSTKGSRNPSRESAHSHVRDMRRVYGQPGEKVFFAEMRELRNR